VLERWTAIAIDEANVAQQDRLRRGTLRPTRSKDRCNETQDREAEDGGDSGVHGKARECGRDASMRA